MKTPARPEGYRGDQRGQALLEVLVSVAIMGLIAAPLGATVTQAFQATDVGAQEAAVVADLQSAVTWLGRDIPPANSMSLPDGGPAQASLTLTWKDRYGDANVTHQAAYALVDTELRRTRDGVTHTVARNVTGVSFLRSGALVTVTITSPSLQFGSVQRAYLFQVRSTE